jgi:hypothetical protein
MFRQQVEIEWLDTCEHDQYLAMCVKPPSQKPTSTLLSLSEWQSKLDTFVIELNVVELDLQNFINTEQAEEHNRIDCCKQAACTAATPLVDILLVA